MFSTLCSAALAIKDLQKRIKSSLCVIATLPSSKFTRCVYIAYLYSTPPLKDTYMYSIIRLALNAKPNVSIQNYTFYFVLLFSLCLTRAYLRVCFVHLLINTVYVIGVYMLRIYEVIYHHHQCVITIIHMQDERSMHQRWGISLCTPITNTSALFA